MEARKTDRLHLRPYTLSDVDDLLRVIYSDATVTHYFCGGTKTRDQVQENVAYRIEQARREPFGFWAVRRKADGAFIGIVGLESYLGQWVTFAGEDARISPLEVELSYAFGGAYQKQGYATEACRAVLAYAFDTLKLRRIAYSVDPENENSWKLMERLGFTLGRDARAENSGDSGVGITGILYNPILLTSVK